MREGGDAKGQLEGYCNWLRKQYVDHRCNCPIGVMGAEFGALPEEVQAVTRKLIEEVLSWLTRVMAVGREQGSFRFEGPPDEKACEVQAALSGAGHCAQIIGAEVYDKTVRQIRRDLEMGD